MEPQGSQEPAPENSLAAVGRKVKSIFDTDQRPSVRILRTSRRSSQPPPVEEPPPPANESGGFFSSLRSVFGRNDGSYAGRQYGYDEYQPETVDVLDVVDPEVSTLSTLTNVQNSLFVPQLGNVVNRRAAYRLQENPEEERRIDRLRASLKQMQSTALENIRSRSLKSPPALERSDTITSTLTPTRYAVLPHGVTLRGWTEADKEELDDMVRHMLHSRRSKFKRSMRGFWQYVRRPLGLFVTVYATLITLFGAAWVLFLIGWISLGSKKDYIINIIDNVLVALFAIIGDGLAPFRAVDTYHMVYIARYHRKTWKKREKMGLPELVDHNDLPEQRKEEVMPKQPDLESLIARRIPRRFAGVVARGMPARLSRRFLTRGETENPSYEYSVLTVEEQATLEHHERKFSKSHTFYKPHETETHYAFPLKLLVAIVILLDLHSCLQIALGVCTWSMEDSRPFVLTTVILCCSIVCNITGGVLISVGDKRTRKKDVLERMMRQELTAEAIEQLENKWLKEAEERGEIDPRIREQREELKTAQEHDDIKREWKAVPSLPKKLLGKGEDHRQPSLPQHEKQSKPQVHAPTHSGPAAPPAAELPKESTGQKVLRLIRRADLDKS